MKIPIRATQPILVISKIVIPTIIRGNDVDIIIVTILVSIILRSFDRRFVIFPNYEDFITYEVVFDIFEYSSIASPHFI